MKLAQLCDSCGFGLWRHECLKCGSSITRGGVIAELCVACSSKAGECIKCHKPIAGLGVVTLLCGKCAFGYLDKKCVNCERHLDQAAASA
jgi:hypothetical protein